jgi:hypothetical protein
VTGTKAGRCADDVATARDMLRRAAPANTGLEIMESILVASPKLNDNSFRSNEALSPKEEP